MRWVLGGAARLVVVAVVVAVAVSACGQSITATEGVAPVTTVAPATTTTTSTTLPTCPEPSAPAAGLTGTTTLASPTSWNLPLSATPGGPPTSKWTEKWGGTATRPVLAEQNGWVEIRLETRPNGSTAWVPAADVTMSSTTMGIVVSICNKSLTLFDGASAVYSAPVGVGQPQWQTPKGDTFVDSIVTTPRNQVYIYGPTVLILGLHSTVFTTFDGGDGTVAIHGYPSDPGSTLGVASSHGCVRASPTTINTIKQVPVGTPVEIVT